MHVSKQVIPLLENIFQPGEQTIISMEQAKAIRDIERFQATRLTIFVADAVDQEDFQFDAVKLRVTSETGEYTWAQRASRVFKEAGPDHTLILTRGRDTTRSIAKGVRTPLVNMSNSLGWGRVFEQTSVVIFDHELKQMYHGFMVCFFNQELSVPRKSKQVKDA